MNGIRWIDDDGVGGEGDGGRALLGGKGASLVDLYQSGFPVPPGFIITTEATRAFDEPETLNAIVAAWSALCPAGEAVAVRSSATDEDGAAASFAGQHETILDVRDREGLLDAVAACVSSLGAEGAAAYRERAGSGSTAAMAVVVQHMVEPAFSGVAFSVDPVSGSKERVIIEAVAGQGAELMAGNATGVRIEVDRATGAMVDGETAAIAGLGDAVGAIAEAALRCEELFGLPQDIEFAYDGDTLWMLQSRPVTAVGMGEVDGGWENEFDTTAGDRTVWTSANVQEVLPGLLTPLTITTTRESSRVGYNIGFQDLNMLDRDEWQPFMGIFYNRAFLNLTLTKMVTDRTLGGNSTAMEQQYLAGDGSADDDREPWLRRARFKLFSLVPLARTLLQLHTVADRMDRQTRALEREVASTDVAALSDEELDATFERIANYGASIFGTHLQVSGIASGGLDLVTRMVRPLLKDATGARVPSLFTGMQGVESARIGVDIWGLAVVARNVGIVEALGEPDFDPGARELPDGWRAAWRTFVATHGHRGLNEMEASTRPWRREPAPVISMVRSYLGLAEDASPPAMLKRQAAERIRLTRELRGQMNPITRKLFNRVLADAQGWVALRERTKSVIVRAARIPDFLMPEMQRRLVAAGVIEQPDDVFFLAREEIREVFRNGVTGPLHSRVVQRRREYERNRHVLLPERFRGQPVPMRPEIPTGSSDVLTGTPVSPGVVTGRARVILDPAVDRGLEPGEILVAPVTDAGWTPLFALASGLVVDLGSALSHGSTVAREYGLPAVVNVHNGTRVIRSGDLLTVDGGRGVVTVVRTED